MQRKKYTRERFYQDFNNLLNPQQNAMPMQTGTAKPLAIENMLAKRRLATNKGR